MVAFAAQTVLRAMRWRSLFARRRRPPRGPVMAATLIGYLFNNIMPARAGEAARVVALTQRTATPAAEIVGTALVERAYDVLSILVIFFCASPWLPHESWFTTAVILAGVAAVGLGVVDLGARRAWRPPAALAGAPARAPSAPVRRSASSARRPRSPRASRGCASTASRSRRCCGASPRG